MNNNVLKVIAGVLALGAVIVAFIGVRPVSYTHLTLPTICSV